ncbi:MAG: cytochrome c [Hyphomicrobiales bacterium]|nr:cytochrome c [Hyphomicrobiales bacterium]
MKLAPRIATAVSLTIVLSAGVAFAIGPIETRKATMKEIGGAFGGVLVKMVKGEKPWNAAEAKAAYDTIVAKANSIDVATMFPKGSESGGETAASPKIWSDPAGFQAALDKFRAVLPGQAEAVGKDVAGLKSAIAEIGKTCKGCHDGYRIEKM